LAINNVPFETPIKTISLVIKEDFKSLIETKEIEQKPSEKSFNRGKPHTKKVLGRSVLTKESKNRSKILTKKPKDPNFEREAYPTESSPKISSKKDLNFSSHFDTKSLGNSPEFEVKKLEMNKEENSPDISPRSKSSLGNSTLLKYDLLSPETKDFPLSSQNKFMKKGLSMKNLITVSSFEIDNKKGKKPENKPESYGNINEKQKISPHPERTSDEINKAILCIQHFFLKILDKREKAKKNKILCPEILEIARNRLNFPNPRRPCDYKIVISKDPYEVLKSIILIQTWIRNILAFRKKLLKKSNESLNEAHISVNCEESNLDSIKSVSFLEQGNDEVLDRDYTMEQEKWCKNDNINNNNICYEKEDDECLN